MLPSFLPRRSAMTAYTYATLSLLALIFVSFSKADSAPEIFNQYDELKRVPPMRLIAHPRVGRSRPSLAEYFAIQDPLYKREGNLMPFPRVGRSSHKKEGGTSSGALWFGPRLGKLDKRFSSYNIDNDDNAQESRDMDEYFLRKLSEDFPLNSFRVKNEK